MFCRNCGAEFQKGDAFCHECGAKVEATGNTDVAYDSPDTFYQDGGAAYGYQQAYPPQPDNVYQQPVAPKKKSKAPVIIIVALILVVLLIGGGLLLAIGGYFIFGINDKDFTDKIEDVLEGYSDTVIFEEETETTMDTSEELGREETTATEAEIPPPTSSNSKDYYYAEYYLEYTDDVMSWSLDEIQLAINTILARNHYRFQKERWLTYFSQFEWYYGNTSDMSEAVSRFNAVERANYYYLAECRGLLE